MKRAYKLQEFVAHSSNVNCLKIGKKSSRVLVTGGEDHKVNMWAIGKPNAILSLAGHTSAVESVAFDASEVVVVAGAASGTIKLWDLEEAKIVRTLTGHRSNCISVDFHPFGEFFASGSLDTNLKIWDIRRKGCIHTYKGHTRGINSIKFSPDGRWVVSGGEDNVVKLWDLTAGKLMHDFKYHEGQVQCLDFHPHEFLLATGSADRTVKFFDLETFELIGSAGPDSAGVRAMVFNPDGRTVLTAMQDSLKVFSWEPLRCHDMVDVGWHKLADLSIHEGKLLGCSFNQSCVGVWVVDLQRVAPYQVGNPGWKDGISVGNKVGNNVNQAAQEVAPIPHSKTDSSMNLPHMMDMAMRNVKITPLKDAESSNSQPIQSAPNSGRRPANVHTTAPSTPAPTLATRRDESCRSQSTKHAMGAEASTTGRVEIGTTKALLAQWERKEKSRLLEKSTLVEKPVVVEKSMSQPRSYVVEKPSSHEVQSGGGAVKTLGLDINSFVPRGSSFQSENKKSAKQDTEIIEELLLQHHTMASIMQSRLTNMQVVRRFWSKNDMKGAIEAMKKMADQSVLVEVLSVFMEKADLLTLEICYMLIPLLNGLLSSDNDRFVMTALELLGKLVATFGPIIHSTRTSASSIGVDLQAEQRLDRCNMCYHELQAVGHSLLPLMRKGGDLTKAAKNLQEALGRV